VLEAAFEEFARHGLDGASTDRIARRAGISQPYLFRLFGTKKELFSLSCARCLAQTLELFRTAAAGKTGQDALQAMGEAYAETIVSEPNRLRGQLQAYAACDDPEIAAVVRKGYGDLVEYVQRVGGIDAQRLAEFFSHGMLLNVIVSLNLHASSEPWARTLLEGCSKRRG